MSFIYNTLEEPNFDIKLPNFVVSIPRKCHRITQTFIKNYAKTLKCDPRYILIFERYSDAAISEYEFISCHYLPNENIDTHLDRLEIGYRVNTKGHSQWRFKRNIEKDKNISEGEKYFSDSFCQLFSRAVDVTNGHEHLSRKNTEFNPEKRYDTLYKKPLQTSAIIYTSDVCMKLKSLTDQLINPVIEIAEEAGFPFNTLKAGVITTNKPHILVKIREDKSDEVIYLVILDSITLDINGILQSKHSPEWINFFMVINAENEDYQNQMV